MRKAVFLALFFLALSGSLRGQVIPRIFSVSPNFAPTGNPQITITVSGEFFHSNSVVQWNASALATTYISSGQLTATLPNYLMSLAGKNFVTVSNPGGGASPSMPFIVLSAPPVYRWAPQFLTQGANTSVIVIGENFLPGSEVVIDNKCYATSTTFISPRQLSATLDGTCITGSIDSHSLSVFFNKATIGVTPDTHTTPPITASVSPASIAFGNQIQNTSSAAAHVISISSGSSLLRVFSISISPSGQFTQTNDCPSQIPVTGQCDVQVVFAPTGTGASSATLSISDNAADTPQTVALTGTGVAASSPPPSSPAVQLSRSGLSFGNVLINTPSSTLTSVLKNTGTANLTISSVTVTGTNAGDFTLSAGGSNCPAGGGTITPGSTCNLAVTFQTSIAQAESASVSIADNAADSPESLPLTATGISSGTSGGTPSVTISSVSPDNGPTGTILVIVGTGFATGTTVEFSNSDVSGVFGAVSISTSTTMFVTVPTLPLGTYNETVCVPTGSTSGTSPTCVTHFE